MLSRPPFQSGYEPHQVPPSLPSPLSPLLLMLPHGLELSHSTLLPQSHGRPSVGAAHHHRARRLRRDLRRRRRHRPACHRRLRRRLRCCCDSPASLVSLATGPMTSHSSHRHRLPSLSSPLLLRMPLLLLLLLLMFLLRLLLRLLLLLLLLLLLSGALIL